MKRMIFHAVAALVLAVSLLVMWHFIAVPPGTIKHDAPSGTP